MYENKKKNNNKMRMKDTILPFVNAVGVAVLSALKLLIKLLFTVFPFSFSFNFVVVYCFFLLLFVPSFIVLFYLTGFFSQCYFATH